MQSPPLRQLDIFAQMVAAGDVVRCAGDLGISVDDVLDELASLELRLGYRLFDDPAGAARLTAAGKKTARAMTLLAHDEEAEPDEQLSAQDAPPAPKQSRHAIVLAAPAPVFGHIQDALAAFEAANDDIAITLNLHVDSAPEAMAALTSGRADIAYFYALEEPGGLASRYGWSEQLNLYAGDAHPLARRDSVDRYALAGVPMLAIGPKNGTHAVIDLALRQARLDLGEAAVASDSMTDVIAAMRAGSGLFAAFGPLARDLGRMPGIRRLALDVPLPAIQIRQAIADAAAGKPAVGALADFLFL